MGMEDENFVIKVKRECDSAGESKSEGVSRPNFRTTQMQHKNTEKLRDEASAELRRAIRLTGVKR
jgi:hypothetical protein